MALGIYKPDQGYWTRMMSAVSIGIIGVTGSMWLWFELSVFDNMYVQGAGVALLLIFTGWLAWWAFGVNRTMVEFFIATEGELRKVNWSTRKEVVGSTWVVITVSAALTVILYTVDFLFAFIFKAIGVLNA